MNTCYICGKGTNKNRTKAYETPWDKKSKNLYFCSDECLENFDNLDDFRYFICMNCGRRICEQNPQNGYHLQYRYLYDHMVCLKCYEAYILEEGIPEEDLKNHIPGMFLDVGDLERAGYKHEGDYFIKSNESIINFKSKVEELMKTHKIVINYDSLGIPAIEGSVELWVKPKQ